MFPKGQETMQTTNQTFHMRQPAARYCRASLLAAALTVTSAFAALAEDVTASLATFALVETVDANGIAVLERRDIDVVLPGSRILYRIDLSNGGAEAVADLTLDLPLPEQLRIDPASFVSDVAMTVTFALTDAPEAYAALPELFVPTQDGGTRPATADDLGAARVTIAELATKQAAFVEYEASVR